MSKVNTPVLLAVTFLAICITFGVCTYSPVSEYSDEPIDSLDGLPNDSISLGGGKKMSLYTFQEDYSAPSWYSRFAANKVAFDKRYDKTYIDIYGKIAEITTEYGCAHIVMKPIDNPFVSIVFSNCPRSEDKWSDAVAEVFVGDMVHIYGEYSAFGSDENEMKVYLSKIIPEK